MCVRLAEVAGSVTYHRRHTDRRDITRKQFGVLPISVEEC